MKEIAPNYNCVIQVLYMVCRMAWNLCAANLAKFTLYKAKYTQAYIDAQLLAIDNAEAFKDEENRDAKSNNLRIYAEQAAMLVCENWQVLKTYIEQAFPMPILANELRSAGSASYARAYALNWADLQALMYTANAFITESLNALIDDGDMPATFAAKFAADAKSCTDKWQAYAQNFGLNRNTAVSKVSANNTIYASVISMCKDARQIFKKDDIKNQFSFAAIKSLAAGNGAGSIRGKVTDPQTGKGIGGVTVLVLNQSDRRTTNRGTFNVPRISAGLYTILFTKEGYDSQTVEVTVQTSTIATCNVALPLAVSMLKVA